MIEIKLPVTVEEDADLFRENARSMWILREDDGSEIIRSAQQNALQRIAAALNAAPKHALTVEALGKMMKDAAVSAGGIFPPKPDEVTWRNRYLTALLSKLQWFGPDLAIGWLFFNPDTGVEFSKNHPIESGEAPEATDIRPATAEALLDELTTAWLSTADAYDAGYHSGSSAPKRAFAELTAEVYGGLVDDALQEVQADPSAFVAGDAEYAALVNAAVLKRLQAFAAPVAPAWQGIETARKNCGPISIGRVGVSTVGVWVEASEDAPDEMGTDAGWLDIAGSLFFPGRSFGALSHQYRGIQPTHWQPLPAAPAGQGGADHE